MSKRRLARPFRLWQTIQSGPAATRMNDDTDFFEPETEPAPKRKPRARRAAAVVEAAVEAVEDAMPPATLDDLFAAGERFVRERPVAALALAAGVGYLLGRFKR